MNKPPLPDAEARRKIVEDLDRTLFVEAGAGSGKTKSLVDRMIALLGAGRCGIRTLAAVTFTRKAAAELRGRFQVELERRVTAETDPEVRERLRDALQNLEQCAIGTIHSFCARLLRERPIEIGLDPGFVELEEIEDRVFRDACWNEYMVKVRLEAEETVRALDEADLRPEDLKDAFDTVSLYPEVAIVGGSGDVPDFAGYGRELERFLDLARGFLPRRRPEKDWDELQKIFVRCFLRQRNLGFTDHRFLMGTLELLDREPKPVWNRWPAREDGETLQAALGKFRETVVAEALRRWREYRHERIVRFLGPAVGFYAERRREENKLDFGDLLMQAARLLRDNPEVRRYFGRKYTHLLVDEFQDTDPIQAEVLLYLKGADAGERDWQKARVEPGALFLVGDPKQSIYRFRRADIDTYNLVKRIVVESGGEVLALTANFRSLESLAEWNNAIFEAIFPERATRHQAAFAPLNALRQIRETKPMTEFQARRESGGESGDTNHNSDNEPPRNTVSVPGSGPPVTGVRKIVLPPVERHKGEVIARADARIIAEWISRRLQIGDSISISQFPGHEGSPAPSRAQPSDFLILFRYKKFMHLYARALEERGVPFEITGSDAFAGSTEIREILNLAAALNDPDNPILTVAVLRGIFFGLSDDELLEWKREGGRFNFAAAGREIVETKKLGAALAGLALAKLREWRGWTAAMPPSAALEKIFEETGILNYLASIETGSSRVGNLLKLLEMLRNEESKGAASLAGLEAFLEELVEVREIEEMSLTPGRESAVRLMNLHKAKGLEARVVFLANPVGAKDHGVDKHVARIPGHDAGDEGDSGEPGGRGARAAGGGVSAISAAENRSVSPGDKARDNRPRGWFVFSKPSGDFQKAVLSQPSGWPAMAEEESRYDEAEEQRLMYVASTRARDLLVVSSYAGDLKNKSWGTLDGHLAAVPELEGTAEWTRAMAEGSFDFNPRPREKAAVDRAELDGARKAIAGNIESAARPTYLVETVTSLARRAGAEGAGSWAARRVRGPAADGDQRAAGKGRQEAPAEAAVAATPGAAPPQGNGLGWGRIVHRTLEAIGSGRLGVSPLDSSPPDAPPCSRPLDLFVENLLTGEEMPLSSRDDLIALVNAIVGSDFWRRLMRSLRRHFEIPFSIRTTEPSLEAAGALPPSRPRSSEGAALPIILTGAIDLVFWEEAEGGGNGGWVIADYKTDKIPGAKAFLKGGRGELTAAEAAALSPEFASIVHFYAPQVRLYARFWSELTGEPVRECGLYFTSINRWVKCP